MENTLQSLPRVHIQQPPVVGTPTKITAVLGAVTVAVASMAKMLFDDQQNESSSQLTNASLYVGVVLLAGALVNSICVYFAPRSEPRELTLEDIAQSLQFTAFDANKHHCLASSFNANRADHDKIYQIIQEGDRNMVYRGPLDENDLPHNTVDCKYQPSMSFWKEGVKFAFDGGFSHGIPTAGVLTRYRSGRLIDRFELSFNGDGTVASSREYNPPPQPAPTVKSALRFRRMQEAEVWHNR